MAAFNRKRTHMARSPSPMSAKTHRNYWPNPITKLSELGASVADRLKRGSYLYEPGETFQGPIGEKSTAVGDFKRYPPDPKCKRVMVIGGTGAGKSTLLNILGGCKLVESESDQEFSWPDQQPVFFEKLSTDSVTQETSCAIMRWFNHPQKVFMAIDTPGYDDTAGNIENAGGRSKLRELAADQHNKMKALGHIHTILICHDQVRTNRLKQVILDVLKMLDEKTEGQCWNNIVVAYTMCNEHETSWRRQLAKKKVRPAGTSRGRSGGNAWEHN